MSGEPGEQVGWNIKIKQETVHTEITALRYAQSTGRVLIMEKERLPDPRWNYFWDNLFQGLVKCRLENACLVGLWKPIGSSCCHPPLRPMAGVYVIQQKLFLLEGLSLDWLLNGKLENCIFSGRQQAYMF